MFLELMEKERVSKILLRTLKESRGKKGIIFLKNGFRYRGIFGESDDKYLEFHDWKVGIKVVPVLEIKDIEVSEKEDEQKRMA